MAVVVVSIAVEIAAFGIWWLLRLLGSPVSTEMAHGMLSDKAGGWVDIVDAGDQPLFVSRQNHRTYP